jgi:small subunit ribosomal protein S10
MKIRIFLKAYNNQLLTKALLKLRKNLKDTDSKCEMTGVVSLPMRFKKFCVLRSPHVDKNSREHFELRFFKCFFDMDCVSSSIVNFLLKLEFPAGIHSSLRII